MSNICDIKVKLDKSQIKNIEKKCIKSLELTAKDMIKDAPIPVDTGNMRDSIKVVTKNKNVAITHGTPYTLRQYFHPEYNHKNGQSEWFKEYINGAKSKFLIDTFTKYYK
jgi:hypothetical protein